MKRSLSIFALFSLVLFVSAVPCFAADDKLPAPLTYTVESTDVAVTSTASDENLAVDTSEEGKPEPNLPEVTAQPNYIGVVNMFVDMSFISMSDVNKAFDKIVDLGGTETKMSMAYVLGVDATFNIIKGIPINLGPRLEYIGCFQGKTVFSGTERDVDVSLIPIMLGGNYEYKLPGIPVSLAGDLYAGYGIAKGKITISGLGSTQADTISGGAFVLDLGVKASYEMFEATSIGLAFGYRMSDVSKMTYDQDDTINGFSKGENVTLDGVNTTKFQLSGLNVGINVNMKY